MNKGYDSFSKQFFIDLRKNGDYALANMLKKQLFMDYLNDSKRMDELVQRVTDKVEADFTSGKISVTLGSKPLDDAIEEINNRLKNLGQ